MQLSGAWKYFVIYLFAPIMGAAFVVGGGWVFVVPLVGFGLIPALELALPSAWHEFAQEETAPGCEQWFSLALFLALPVQAILLALFLRRAPQAEPVEWLGMVWTMGIACGVFGINVAHELGHRAGAANQMSALLLYSTALYSHMLVHHNRVHHPWVGTDRDPNTARPGENLFAFWVRSISASYLAAWNEESRRLRRQRKGALSLSNQMLVWQAAQAICLCLVFLLLGAKAAASLGGAALIGVLMLETINYIEHYGLLREPAPGGRLEPAAVHHAWNSEPLLGRVLLFQVTRHSDHHLHPTKAYQRLRRLPKSPEMPTGYPGMMILATLPPLWFRVMNPRLAAVRSRDSEIRVNPEPPASGLSARPRASSRGGCTPPLEKPAGSAVSEDTDVG